MDRPKVGLAVIILKKREVLLGKRINAHGEGTLCFPGGHLEAGESLENCAYRETREEAGDELKVELFDSFPSAATNDIFQEEDRHYITLFMRAWYRQGKPRIIEPDKCEEWRWVDWYNLRNMKDELFLPIQNLLEQRYNPFFNAIK